MKTLNRMLTLSLTCLLLAGEAGAQPAAPPPSGPPPMIPASAPAEPDAIPLYGDRTPGSSASEIWSRYGGKEYAVRNVTRPTLTPVLPDRAKATGAAVVVVPGGGFMALAMEHEGWNVARALAEQGIAAFVLKYRVIPTPRDEGEAGAFMGRKIAEGLAVPTKQPTLQYPLATEDALAALALVRGNGAKWGVDPGRVGMIGFSAGAITSLNTKIGRAHV